MRVVTFKADEKIIDLIDMIANRENVSRSEAIRRAIVAYARGKVYKREKIRVRRVVLT